MKNAKYKVVSAGYQTQGLEEALNKASEEGYIFQSFNKRLSRPMNLLRVCCIQP